MQKQQPLFNRKKLVIAVSVAMLGGVLSGCNENDPIGPDALGDWALKGNGGTAGNMTSASGGDGGRLYLNNNGSTGGIDVSTRSKANTTFTTPVTPPAANFGSNWLNITADTTIKTVDYNNPVDDLGLTTAGEIYVGTDDILRVAAGAAAAYATDPVLGAGMPYLRFGDVAVYQAGNGVASDDVRFTGLSVAAGATLTLSQNNSGYNSDIGENVDGVIISFREDIDNSGTITRSTANSGTDLALVARHYIASGNIANAGIDSADGDADGGNVAIFASNGISNSGRINASGFDDPDSDDAGDGGAVWLQSGGYVLNSGAIDVSGGDAPGSGGDGGEVDMSAAYSESTGDIDMSGGNNTSDPSALVPGDGGDGGTADINADYIAINTAAIDGSGGDGSNGGHGAYVYVSNDTIGEVKNAGNINLNGGAGSEGSGGYGGELDLYAYGGDALNSGNVTAVGGNSAADLSPAGDGGYLYFSANYGDDSGQTPPGDVEVSGNLDVSGGNAVADEGTGYGGDAGEIALDGGDGGEFYPLASYGDYANSRVALLGYVSIDLNGGDGANGGDAANQSVWMATYVTESADPEAEGYEDGDTNGSIVNDVPVNARGGNSTATGTEMGAGGDGGEVMMYAAYGPFDPSGLDSQATNKAAIDLSGGNAVNDELSSYPAGDGGRFNMVAAAMADNSGAISANGGAGGSYNGYGGNINIAGMGGGSNSGALMANGGNGGESGGNGGETSIYGGSSEAKNTGELTANGGTGSYNGGRGGYASVGGATSVNNANISVNGANATVIDPEDLITAYGGDGGYINLWGNGINSVTNTGTLSYLFGTGEEDGDEGSADVGIVCEGNCTP